MEKGFLIERKGYTAAPVVRCESCGTVIRDYRMAWVMWKDVDAAKPKVLCKTKKCNSKPEYLGLASMELGTYLIDLLANSGMTPELMKEAFAMAELTDKV